MESFNGVTILNYINWSFNLIQKPKNDEIYSQMSNFMKTRVLLCHTHFFKNIVIKTNEILRLKESVNEEDLATRREIKQIFQLGIAILQKSTSMSYFDRFLKNLFIIFCVPQ